MNTRDMLALTIKIAGIVLFVMVVADLPEYFQSYLSDSANNQDSLFWSYFIPLLIPGLVSVLLFTFPYTVTNKVLSLSKDEPVDLSNLELILVRLLGILLLYLAFSDLVFHVSNYVQLRAGMEENFPLSAYNYSYLFATAAEFVFAFWLLVGTTNVINILNRLRRK